VIYFLINNNYHLDFDNPLIQELKDYQIGLILIPFRFDKNQNNLDVFSEIHEYENNVNLSFFNFFSIKRFLNKIKNKIKVNAEDILFVHTDMVLLNQFFIYKFYNSGAKIFLLEDGTASICDFNIIPQRAKIKSRLKCLVLKYFLGFKNTNVKKYGAQDLFRIDDFYFKMMLLKYGNLTLREIPIRQLCLPGPKLDIMFPDGAIFFNSPFYLIYTNEDIYIEYLKDILFFSDRFNPFFFTFHPFDTPFFKDKIKDLFKDNFKNIQILPDGIAEKIIKDYTTKFSISINSTASYNLMERGITPIFLNNLFLNHFSDPSFEQFKALLYSIGYVSPKSLDEVSPSFSPLENVDLTNKNRISIKQVLKPYLKCVE
jgi:hypothetical protein